MLQAASPSWAMVPASTPVILRGVTMKKLLVAAVLVGSTAGFAQAADPIMAHPVVVAPDLFDWTGFYVGGQVGVLAGSASYVAPNVAPTVVPFPTSTGFLAGVHA